jgi:penicillin amidase
MRRLFKALLAFAILLLIGGGGGAWWVRSQMRASLPQIDGTLRLAGLAGTVTVERDALGIPTIRGRSREDVARATGFVHGQDRFFQMDLTRRRAAGELAALVGEQALEADRDIRVHRFRAEAARALSLLPAADRAIVEAYAGGVNAGLASLTQAPFEYLLLRQTPQRWRPEDCLLVVLSMFITLQDPDAAYESMLGTMREVLPPQMAAFVSPPGTEWDTPIVGGPLAMPPIPGPEVYNLRQRRTGKPPVPITRAVGRGSRLVRRSLGEGGSSPGEALGSNNWVVSGAHTDTGAPLVANDMHLGIRVPNIWYRAVLEWSGATLMGVTLPGVPALVVGSNTHIAWGFTNTYADWADLILLELDPANPNRYRTPDGWREFAHHAETIAVAGDDTAPLDVRWTIWGPVTGTDHRGRLRAMRWVAHSAEQLAARGVRPFEAAATIDEAFADANGRGTPGQNMVVADRSGRIGWTIYGSIPRRVGLDGAVPSSWADGTRRWSGWLDPAEYPRLVDPADGRLWTANARVVDGDMLATLGDNSYEIGSRARIIRDRLRARERFSTRDMLSIQLDTSARFIERWRDLLLRSLTPAAASTPERAALRRFVQTDWTGDASPSSAAYGFSRRFRDEVSTRVMTFLVSECYEADPAFDHTANRRREGPVWALLTARPLHLLDPQFASWDELLLASIDAVVASATGEGTLEARTWGDYNVTTYRHPLSPGLPFIGRLLDMPVQSIPGDLYTPRVSWNNNAASQRMVVSPGREAEGIMQMPTGQSGHPLSPFYANSHPAWVSGEPTPFLPGRTEHRLTLTP